MNFEAQLAPAGKEFEMYRLMVEQACLDGDTLLSEASDFFQKQDCRYAAVVSDGRVLGVCSRSKIGALLGAQFGYALYSRSCVKDFLEEGSSTVVMGEALESILLKAFARDESQYWQDVVVTDQEGTYLGLIRANTLVRLQSELLGEKVGHLEARKKELESTTEALSLSNQKLERARDAGLQAARAKSEFLAVMSHEIRTPLNGVIGMMTLLGDSKLNDDQREILNTANQSAEALLLILNDILDFSRLESGKVELEQRSFDVRELVESVVTLMLEAASETGLEIVCDIAPTVPGTIVSDSGRIRQVLANLLGNAVKFTEKGRISLSVALEDERVGSGLLFSVADSGIGISKEAQDRLFQPFAQADSSTTRRFGGTGLGLAICSQLVKALGGEIGVDSAPGEGSRFWFKVATAADSSEWTPYRPERAKTEKVALVCMRSSENSRQVERELACRNIVSLVANNEELFQELLRNCKDRIDLLVVESCFLNDEIGEQIRELPCVSVYPTHGSRLHEDIGQRRAHLYLPIRPLQLGRCVESTLLAKPKSHSSSLSMPAAERSDTNVKKDARILIVEDNAINRRLAMHLVERFGYATEQAEDGQIALDLCEKQTFDVILLDCRMPNMDGYEFARIFREREVAERPGHRTPIVALTANALVGDKELCFAAGMDAYLTKPLKKPALRSVIELALSGRIEFAHSSEKGTGDT